MRAFNFISNYYIVVDIPTVVTATFYFKIDVNPTLTTWAHLFKWIWIYHDHSMHFKTI